MEGIKTPQNIEKASKLDPIYNLLFNFLQLSETSNLVSDNFCIDLLSILIQNITICNEIALDLKYTPGEKLNQLIELGVQTSKTQPLILKNLIKCLFQLLNAQKQANFVKMLAGKILTKIIGLEFENHPVGLISLIEVVLGDISIKNLSHPDIWNSIRRLGLLLSIPPRNSPEIYYENLVQNFLTITKLPTSDNFVIYCKTMHSFFHHCFARLGIKKFGKILDQFSTLNLEVDQNWNLDQLHGLLFIAKAYDTNIYPYFIQNFHKLACEKLKNTGKIEVDFKNLLQILYILHEKCETQEEINTCVDNFLYNLENPVEILKESRTKPEFVFDFFMRVFEKYSAAETDEEKFQFLVILTSLVENFDEKILIKKPKNLLKFVVKMIESLVTESSEAAAEDETKIRLILAVLSLFISSLSDFDKEIKQQVRNLTPVLQKLQNQNLSIHVKEMLSDLLICLATFSLDDMSLKDKILTSLKEDNKPKRKTTPDRLRDGSPANRPEEILPGDRKDPESENLKKFNQTEIETLPKSGIFKISDCFELLKQHENDYKSDLAIAMKAGAIRSLTYHLKNKTLPKSKLALTEKYFESNLEKSFDNFLYLSCIQGLSCLPGYDLEKLIKRLNVKLDLTGSTSSSSKTRGSKNKTSRQNYKNLKTPTKPTQLTESDKILKLKLSEVLIRILDKKSILPDGKLLNCILNTISNVEEHEFSSCPDVISSGVLIVCNIFIKIDKTVAFNNKFEVFNLLIRLVTSTSEVVPRIIKHSALEGLNSIFKEALSLA